MKKTLFVALLACFTMMFASCNKEKELTGTSWKTHTDTTQQMTMEGITATMHMVIDGTMKFSDATNGSLTLTTSGEMSAMGMSFPIEEETETQAFTYTFDGEAGTITVSDDEETLTMPFTYNKKENTINFSISETDEETGATIAFDMVFTEVK
ncbi:MAG: hypothetical protein IJK84_04020 [Bacteroidales bacterium]|nr:hypothetical protein [Bacteroidales bacterium]